MNEEELREELEGSRLDVQAACTRVCIRSLPRYTAQTAPAWMTQHPVQAIITCHIAPPSSPPAAASSLSQPASASDAASPILHAAACMPAGYALLHCDGAEAEADAERTSDAEAAASSASCWRFDAPLRFFPSLNGLLLHHSAQYTANKQAELTRKLQALTAAQQEEDDVG